MSFMIISWMIVIEGQHAERTSWRAHRRGSNEEECASGASPGKLGWKPRWDTMGYVSMD